MHDILGFGLAHVATGGDMAPWVLPVLAVLAVWELFWKGLALWHAAQRGEKWWFVAILIVNTAGILELIYLFLIARMKGSELFTSKA